MKYKLTILKKNIQKVVGSKFYINKSPNNKFTGCCESVFNKEKRCSNLECLMFDNNGNVRLY